MFNAPVVSSRLIDHLNHAVDHVQQHPQRRAQSLPVLVAHARALALAATQGRAAAERDVEVDSERPSLQVQHSSAHLRRDSSHPCHICAGTRLTLPHLPRDWAYLCHICAGTGLTPATSAPGLGSPLPELRRDRKAAVARTNKCASLPVQHGKVGAFPRGRG